MAFASINVTIDNDACEKRRATATTATHIHHFVILPLTYCGPTSSRNFYEFVLQNVCWFRTHFCDRCTRTCVETNMNILIYSPRNLPGTSSQRIYELDLCAQVFRHEIGIDSSGEAVQNLQFNFVAFVSNCFITSLRENVEITTCSGECCDINSIIAVTRCSLVWANRQNVFRIHKLHDEKKFRQVANGNDDHSRPYTRFSKFSKWLTVIQQRMFAKMDTRMYAITRYSTFVELFLSFERAADDYDDYCHASVHWHEPDSWRNSETIISTISRLTK